MKNVFKSLESFLQILFGVGNEEQSKKSPFLSVLNKRADEYFVPEDPIKTLEKLGVEMKDALGMSFIASSWAREILWRNPIISVSNIDGVFMPLKKEDIPLAVMLAELTGYRSVGAEAQDFSEGEAVFVVSSELCEGSISSKFLKKVKDGTVYSDHPKVKGEKEVVGKSAQVVYVISVINKTGKDRIDMIDTCLPVLSLA